MDTNRLLIFKVCVAALWANEKMAKQERDYINNLIERLSETHEEESYLKGIQTHDINLKSLELEIKSLSEQDKQRIFEECFGVITSDKILDELDINFIKKLKNICAISNKYYANRIKEARVYKGVKIKRRIKRLVAVLIVSLLAYQFLSSFITKKYFKDEPGENIVEDVVDIQLLSNADAGHRTKISPNDIYNTVCRSVVTIYVKEKDKRLGQGTGSIIGRGEKYYYVLTNKHVAVPEKSKKQSTLNYEIQLYTGARFDAHLDCYSRNYDLALLRTKIPDEYIDIIKISPKIFQSVGDRVYSLGTPIGMTNTFTEGIISALRDDYIQTDATIFYGNSGGPLINEYAELIGVVTRGYIFKDYSFAVYADNIVDFLEERKVLNK